MAYRKCSPYIASLVACAAFAFGCGDNEIRQLNQHAESVISKTKGVSGEVTDLAKGVYNETVAPVFKPVIDDTVQTIETAAEASQVTKQAAEQISGTWNEASEFVSETKRVAVNGAATAQRTAKSVVRKAPRSRREANMMVERHGRGFFDWMRERMAKVTGRHSGAIGDRVRTKPRSVGSKGPKRHNKR